MSIKPKKKLCWNCEGNVEEKHENCPYCGVSMNVSPLAGTKTADDLLAPPYRSNSSNKDQSIPKAPYSNKEEPPAEVVSAPATTGEFQSAAVSLTFLTVGSVFALFSLVLALFSDKQGVLTLHWHASYWYIYLLIALPLLYLGWRGSARLIQSED